MYAGKARTSGSLDEISSCQRNGTFNGTGNAVFCEVKPRTCIMICGKLNTKSEKKMSEQIKLVFIVAVVLAAQNSHTQSTNAVPSAGPVTKLPEVIVTGAAPKETRPGWLQEEQFVGPYRQPEWTTERRFPGTRVYLQQMPWEIGFEQWVRIRRFRDGTMETRMQEEFEIGLPHRFQIDLYETWAIDQDRRFSQDEYSAEVRYA